MRNQSLEAESSLSSESAQPPADRLACRSRNVPTFYEFPKKGIPMSTSWDYNFAMYIFFFTHFSNSEAFLSKTPHHTTRLPGIAAPSRHPPLSVVAFAVPLNPIVILSPITLLSLSPQSSLGAPYLLSLFFPGPQERSLQLDNEQKKHVDSLRYRVWPWHACQGSSLRIRTVRHPPPPSLQSPRRSVSSPRLPPSLLFGNAPSLPVLYAARIASLGNVR